MCLVISNNGKESEKEWIYISLSVYLKLTQHCKPAIYSSLKKKNNPENEVRYPNEEKFTLFITFNEKVKSFKLF